MLLQKHNFLTVCRFTGNYPHRIQPTADFQTVLVPSIPICVIAAVLLHFINTIFLTCTKSVPRFPLETPIRKKYTPLVTC